jgi:hypothetical protein
VTAAYHAAAAVAQNHTSVNTSSDGARMYDHGRCITRHNAYLALANLTATDCAENASFDTAAANSNRRTGQSRRIIFAKIIVNGIASRLFSLGNGDIKVWHFPGIYQAILDFHTERAPDFLKRDDPQT